VECKPIQDVASSRRRASRLEPWAATASPASRQPSARPGEEQGSRSRKLLSRSVNPQSRSAPTTWRRNLGSKSICLSIIYQSSVSASSSGTVPPRWNMRSRSAPVTSSLAPGYQVDRGRLENHLAQCFREAGGGILEGAAVRELTVVTGHTDAHRGGVCEGTRALSAHHPGG